MENISAQKFQTRVHPYPVKDPGFQLTQLQSTVNVNNSSDIIRKTSQNCFYKTSKWNYPFGKIHVGSRTLKVIYNIIKKLTKTSS